MQLCEYGMVYLRVFGEDWGLFFLWFANEGSGGVL